jgi:enoyl-CoA hydratase/carnithine racemase
MEMMLLGDKLSAEKARELGLLTRVVPDDKLDAEVANLAAQLAARSPTALRMGLQAYHHQIGVPLQSSLPYLRDQLMAMLATEDGREGLAAFIQKREPKWTGR